MRNRLSQYHNEIIPQQPCLRSQLRLSDEGEGVLKLRALILLRCYNLGLRTDSTIFLNLGAWYTVSYFALIKIDNSLI